MKLWVFLIFISILNISFLLPPKQELQVIFHNPFLSYQQRLRLKLGSPFYEYINFIEFHIPTNSLVAIPPETQESGMYGNFLYMKYWLYPRELTTDLSVADYSLIVQSQSGIWPGDQLSTQKQILQTNPLLGLQKLQHD